MTIKAYKDPKLSQSAGEYTFVVNPKPFKQGFKVSYDKPNVKGSSASNLKFKKVDPQKMTFEFLFDATGVLGESDPVDDQLEDFKDLCYNYQGAIHSPYYLKLIWGKLLFDCRLTCMDVEYTFFKQDGTPLRAVVKATFTEFTDAKTIAKEENRSSPDLTHMRVVRQGDTLPLMCFDIYGDSSYYLKVAEYNRLSDVRELQPGQKLFFPPVK